jgi:DNA polymerase-3 subunit gamma/tau
MSADTVLARKWRPRQFSQVVGQEPVVRALSQALTSGRLHHAYLFTGTRGVGKTTLARIFAKALNCRDGITAEPCTDDIAQSIDEGRFVDLIEIDAASRTKVEDTRELLDNVQYAPSVGRYKIYIIDEVHMLSTHSFNALLKTLEEPPAHVKFLLATTDPHKLPVTILSRCLQFHLRPMTPEILVSHLANVLTSEGVAFEDDAIALVSRLAQGSVRDALSLLDQAIVLGGGAVGYESTREMLGLASDAQITTLIQALVAQDTSAALAQLREWLSWGADFDRLQQQLLQALHDVALLQSFPDLSPDYDADRVALVSQVSREQVQIWLQVALLAQDDMRLAPTAQMGFELMLMRLLHFRASASCSVGVSTPMATPVRTASVVASIAKAAVAQPAPVQQTQSVVPSGDPRAAMFAALGMQKAPAAEKKTVEFPPPVVTLAPIAEQITTQLPSAPVEAIATYPIDAWLDIIAQWRLGGMELELARKCVRLKTDDAQAVRLAYPASERSSVTMLGDKLTQAIARVGLKLVWHQGWQDAWLTPVQQVQQLSEQVLVTAKQDIGDNSRFQALCATLDLTPNWAQLTHLAEGK